MGSAENGDAAGKECVRPRHHGRRASGAEERRALCRGRHPEEGRPQRGAAGHRRHRDRPHRPDLPAGLRQHPPPPQPDAHPQLPGRAGQQPLPLAEGALSRLGADDAGSLARQHPGRPRRAGALRLHHGLRPFLRLQERQQRRLPDRGRAGHRRALPCQPRVDVARRIQGRAAAGRLRGGGALHPEGQPEGHREVSRRQHAAR